MEWVFRRILPNRCSSTSRSRRALSPRVQRCRRLLSRALTQRSPTRPPRARRQAVSGQSRAARFGQAKSTPHSRACRSSSSAVWAVATLPLGTWRRLEVEWQWWWGLTETNGRAILFGDHDVSLAGACWIRDGVSNCLLDPRGDKRARSLYNKLGICLRN